MEDKFKKLTKKDIKYMKEVYLNKDLSWDERINTLTEKFNVSERSIRKWLVKLGVKEKVNVESEHFKQAKKRKFDKKSKYFIVTYAQNNTEVFKPFFDNILAYKKFLGASLHVIAGRYGSPTTLAGDKKFAEEWDFLITDGEYLDANRHDIHKYVSILSDIKIMPTAVSPMSGMEGITGINSCIMGHPHVQMDVVPAVEGGKCKLMLTTGSITKPNFTSSKAGQKAKFHHVYAFIIVEIKDSETFFVRQVTADKEGNFIDLFFETKNKKVKRINQISCAILGDVHLAQVDEKAMNKNIELLEKLKPEKTIIHDIMDSYSISHHHLNDPIKLYEKEKNGTNSLKAEIDNMLVWLKKMSKYNPVIVYSNHNDFIDRWIRRCDWRTDIKNSIEYMQYAQACLEGKCPKGIVAYIIDKNLKNIKTLGPDDSFKIHGFELAVHGDRSFGKSSMKLYTRMSSKIVVGHFHVPTRRDGALSVGTLSKLKMDYAIGFPSASIHSSVLIHTNGKAQHVNFINGEYTTLK